LWGSYYGGENFLFVLGKGAVYKKVEMVGGGDTQVDFCAGVDLTAHLRNYCALWTFFCLKAHLIHSLQNPEQFLVPRNLLHTSR